ncbi:MAG: bifunctional folylpolyglutamate synthase/dihydrofolate synthase [Acidobacteriota bacterium]
MTYEEAAAYLQRLIRFGIKTGLDHTRHLAGRLGNPEGAHPNVIVGGTNGKGSTSAFLEAILRFSGYRTGLYTSPHLVEVRERIRVGGEPVSPEALAQSLAAVRAAAEGALREGVLEEEPTYFEALTLAAFHRFREERVEVAVLEVGLGGGKDCTNAAPAVLCAVTNVALDHEEYLGPGLLSIAREKAGIFRAGAPALTGERSTWALRVMRQEAARRGARLTLPDWEVFREREGWRFGWRGGEWAFPAPALAGDHQVDNAALAVRCALELRERGFSVTGEALRRGIAEARWPGRLEKAAASPDLYLDGAHNPAGCTVLARFVASLPHRRKALVFTALKDKPVEQMAAVLFGAFGKVFFTEVPMARGEKTENLRRLARWEGEAAEEPDPAAALRAAAEWSGREGMVVAAGSLYLIGYLKGLSQSQGLGTWGSGL